jgi:DNA-binding response OmpR family regulator
MSPSDEVSDTVHYELLDKLGAGRAQRCSFGDIALVLPTKKLQNQRGYFVLTDREYLLLWLLVRAQGSLITQDEMMYFIYDEKDKDIPLSNCLEVFLSRLRKKISALSQTVAIETFRSIGYRLVLQ